MNQSQKVAVITGASSGIGLEAAKSLAKSGWYVIGTGRNPERSAAAKEQILAESSSGRVDFLQADLSLMSDARQLADKIQSLTDRVDVLMNNAGGMATELVMTSEGLEENFAGNHLGPFVLTNALLPLLANAAERAESGSVRIINTSSDAGEMIPGIDTGDLQNLNNYSVGLAYCASKLANVLFTRALAKRLEDKGIVTHAFHPGVVSSNFFAHFSEEAMSRVSNHDVQTPEQGAQTLIWLATAEEPGKSNGGYFYKCAPRDPNAVAMDDELLERFWSESEKLIASV